MVVTNYYTVNGSIIGESTNGVRTDYLMDALGSVTGTVNSSAQVINTYRYKPFGDLLSKTGTGADPAFGWVGTQGYKQTQKKFSNFYVRARHYGSVQGRWTTKDPIGLEGSDLSLYQFVESNPTSWSDSSGYQCDQCKSQKGSKQGRVTCDAHISGFTCNSNLDLGCPKVAFKRGMTGAWPSICWDCTGLFEGGKVNHKNTKKGDSSYFEIKCGDTITVRSVNCKQCFVKIKVIDAGPGTGKELKNIVDLHPIAAMLLYKCIKKNCMKNLPEFLCSNFSSNGKDEGIGEVIVTFP